MIKTLFLSAILLGSALLASSQTFEGEIIYQNSFKSNLPQLSNGKLDTLFGNQQEYYIRGGRYKSVTNGTVAGSQVYDPVSNKLYSQLHSPDRVISTDASVRNEEVVSFELKPKAETILGNLCDALTINTKSGSMTYYFCSKYKVNAAAYATHHFENWDFVTAKMGTLPLKIVVHSSRFDMTSVAIAVKEMKLTDDDFKIPRQ